MSSVKLVNVLDAARSFGDDPRRATDETVGAWLIEAYARQPRGSFNYDPATTVLYDLFRGVATESDAALYCATRGNPKGRRQNASAIRAVSAYAAANVSTCYRIGFTAVAVGRVQEETVYLAIKAPMVRVVHDHAYVVLPGFRMSHRPTPVQIDLACSIALATLARDDFADADFEYLYAGPGVTPERTFQPIHGRQRRLFDRDEVDALLDVYVRGVARALQAGVNSKRPDLRKYHIIDPREPTLF